MLSGPLPRADNDDWLDAVHIDGINHADLHRTIPALLDTSIAERLRLIIRPYGPNVMFIQLDDLSADKLPSLAPTMFLSFQTSPANYQAWLAIPGEHDKGHRQVVGCWIAKAQWIARRSSTGVITPPWRRR